MGPFHRHAEEADVSLAPGRRMRMSPRAALACALALLLAATTLVTPAQAVEIDLDSYEGTLSWQIDESKTMADDTPGAEGTSTYFFRLVDANGSPVTSLRLRGHEVDLSSNHNQVSGNEAFGGSVDGIWAKCSRSEMSKTASEQALSHITYDASDQVAASSRLRELIGEVSGDHAGDLEDGAGTGVWDKTKGKAIREDSPVFDLTDIAGSLQLLIVKFLYANIVSPLLYCISDLCRFMLSAIDPSALFSADFKSGSFSALYDVAKQVNDDIAVPYGTAFLGIVFALQLLEPGRSRGHMPTEQWLDTTFRQLALLLVAWTLITHAMDVVYFIYWLGSNLCQFISERILQTTFLSGSTSMGASVSGLINDKVSGCTYEEFGGLIALLLFAGGMLMTVYKCVVKVFTVSFLRMAEVYLRAAFAAVPFAFIAGERSRQIGLTYLKRYAATCFQAAVIVVALSFMGLLFAICSSIVGAALDAVQLTATGYITAWVIDAAKVAAPTIIGLSVATAVIEKTESLSASLFGLA